MAGFLKKIFSFGFGGKKDDNKDAGEPPVTDENVVDPADKVKLGSTEPEPVVVEKKIDQIPKAATRAKTKPASNKTAGEKAANKKIDGSGGKKTDPGKPATGDIEAKGGIDSSLIGEASKDATSQVPKREIHEIAGDNENLAPVVTEHPETVSTPTTTSQSNGIVSLGKGGQVETETREIPDDAGKRGWFGRLRQGLALSSTQLSENVTSIFTKRRLDEDTLMELEDVLIQADLGIDTAIRITQALSDQRYGKNVSQEEVREIMAAEIEKTLSPVALPLELDLEHKPHVILVVGVNGSGKTTTIGKLTAKLASAGLSTLLVAGDTFRAAAIEQLKVWGERTGAPVVSRDLGSDAASLAFDAYQQAKADGHNVMLMDTAGRLQNKSELMDELAKIIRVLKKHDASAPHTVLLTLDATTGQNALNQVEVFGKVAGVNGLVMTKLDGTARGGILVAISAKFNLPVYFVGVGEQVEDLEPFEARDFARSIAGFSE